MTLVLEVTPEQERQLEAEAARDGLSLRDWALRRLLGEEEGLFSDPDLPAITAEEFRQYVPVSIAGRPLSETLIDDRR